MLKSVITSQTELSLSLCNQKQRINNTTLNWKRERFDNLIFLFNNQSLSMSKPSTNVIVLGKDSSNNILTLKSSLNEISRAVNLNFTMRINFPDKRDPSFCDREAKMTIGIHVFIKAKSLWQMSKRFPETVV